MNVFLSWSGEKSKASAEAFNDWLQCVLQPVKPWISTTGIEGGSVWFDEISSRLSDTSVGIIFLTQSNKNSPWIMFEAGALAKGLKKSRVTALLIDLEPSHITNPLSNFNHAFIDKKSIYKLLAEFNNMLGESSLPHTVLEKVFNKNWDDLERKLSTIRDSEVDSAPAPKRDNKDVMDEILLNTRRAINRIDKLERENFLSQIDNENFIDSFAKNAMTARELDTMLKKSAYKNKDIGYKITHEAMDGFNKLVKDE